MVLFLWANVGKGMISRFQANSRRKNSSPDLESLLCFSVKRLEDFSPVFVLWIPFG